LLGVACSPKPSWQVFFARVLRSADEDTIKQLFAQFGRIVKINLFRAFQGGPISKGCGLVTMDSADEANAAIQGLHEKHIFEGMAQPMVVRWMDAALQRRRQEEHSLMKHGSGHLLTSQGSTHGPNTPPLDAANSGDGFVLASGGSELPPPGCAPDSYKLFIGNIPVELTERVRLLLSSVVGSEKGLMRCC